MRRREKWLDTGEQKALRVTHGSQRLLMLGRNTYVGQFSSTRRLAQFDIAAMGDMVPTSKQAKLVSKLLSERRVSLLVGVVDCNNGADR